MYNPPAFAEHRTEALYAFARRHPLAALVSGGDEGPEATHVPMIPHSEEGANGVFRCHLARANSHWKRLDGARVLAIFQGASQYISPSWYPSKQEHGKVVPTWNYLVVHVRGRARVFEDSEEILRHVAALTEAQESAFSQPWSVDDAPREYLEGLSRGIVGVEIAIESMEGKWKVSQNRPDADRQGVIEALSGTEMAKYVAERGFGNSL